MDKIKKYLKPVGICLTVIALIYLVKKIIEMDVDFSEFTSQNMLCALAIAVAFQTVLILVGCYPWLNFIKAFSDKEISFNKAMSTYAKSNILKYIPGNVFQYIGRNKLASDMNISHIDVACSTALDIFFNIFVTGIFSILLLGKSIAVLLEKYKDNFVIFFAVAALCLAIAIIILFCFKKKIGGYLSRYIAALKGKNKKFVISGCIYYIAVSIISSVIYMICAKLIFSAGISGSDIIEIVGAYFFAWIIGFVTPGSPGGIGIRESVMLMICSDAYKNSVVLFVLMFRLSSIIADIMAFIIVLFSENIGKLKKSDK